MNTFKTLTIHGQTYAIASDIQDDTIAKDTTWSSEKIDDQLGNVEASLDAILALQNTLMGGDGA